MASNNSETRKLPSKKKNVHIKRKVQKPYVQKMLYSFETFDEFCDFCTFLSQNINTCDIQNLAKIISLYEYNSNYYLDFSGINLESNLLDFFCMNITEFAHFVENPMLFERQIMEYGTPIIKENALFVGITYFAKKVKSKKEQIKK